MAGKYHVVKGLWLLAIDKYVYALAVAFDISNSGVLLYFVLERLAKGADICVGTAYDCAPCGPFFNIQ